MKWPDGKIVEWHIETFPEATPDSQIAKMDEELRELLLEAADAYIAATSADLRFGSIIAKIFRFLLLKIFGQPLLDAVDMKMDINVKRTFKGDHHVETIN
jgi:hypothetical protein